MLTLNITAQQAEANSELINNTAYTHVYDYDSYNDVNNNAIEYFTDMFESNIANKYDAADDVGAVIIYYKDNNMIAFYDYELFRGTVFN